ncbi:hypothetical protein B0H67DRAFT_647222 [Lasiosphaeris hirsuta]|uniref:Uncharacterized protein n=1 Tax=Lasiosphaeris hirsuta TaxID=260670 RepID=A0AA40A9Q3_9PEZI|nr:hypothetical protein B0H67DRAFT_647222 [Lasiosphaeris hirsuta]
MPTRYAKRGEDSPTDGSFLWNEIASSSKRLHLEQLYRLTNGSSWSDIMIASIARTGASSRATLVLRWYKDGQIDSPAPMTHDAESKEEIHMPVPRLDIPAGLPAVLAPYLLRPSVAVASQDKNKKGKMLEQHGDSIRSTGNGLNEDEKGR